jgi:hypothetical protein
MALRGSRRGADRIVAQIESNTAPLQGGTARHQEKPPHRAQEVSGATAPADVKRGLRNAKADAL